MAKKCPYCGSDMMQYGTGYGTVRWGCSNMFCDARQSSQAEQRRREEATYWIRMRELEKEREEQRTRQAYSYPSSPSQVREYRQVSFVVRIPQSIYEEMVAHVIETYPNMACGALGSVDEQVVKHYPTANAAMHPDDFAIVAETDLVRIFNDIDSYDGEMIFYLSHTWGEAYPSQRDIEWAKHSGRLYIIFSCQYYPNPPYARVFSIDENGVVTEGRVELV